MAPKMGTNQPMVTRTLTQVDLWKGVNPFLPGNSAGYVKAPMTDRFVFDIWWIEVKTSTGW